MRLIDFSAIVEAAWQSYDPKQPIKTITDISVMVSTNHVYKIQFSAKQFLIAKLSYFGTYEHFREDHSIVNVLAHGLKPPYDRTIGHSLMKEGSVFTYRYQQDGLDVWVVFYRPVRFMRRLPKRLGETDIVNLGRQLALFHKACAQTLIELPPSSKTMPWDVKELLLKLDRPEGALEFGSHVELIRHHAEAFLEGADRLGYEDMRQLPVFVDWNSGNFSLSKTGRIFSRWDYDWFRVCPRVMDFFFMSRVVSDIGDQTQFSYVPDTLMEPRFLLFLQQYQQHYPLDAQEIRFIKESYRFFILQYVIKYGRYFFHPIYADRLQKEAFQLYLPRLEEVFDADKLLRACNL